MRFVLPAGFLLLTATFAAPGVSGGGAVAPPRALALSPEMQDDEAEALARLNELLDLARSKDPVERETAATGLGEEPSQKADAALLKLAEDEDVIVQLAAIRAMAGRESTSVTKLLTKLALESPFTRVRRAAAESLAKTNGEEARDALLKKASGKTALRAAEALLWAEALAASQRGEAAQDPKAVEKDVKGLRKMQKSKDPDERVAAAGAAVAISTRSGEPRAELIQEGLVEHLGDYKASEMACAVLEAVERAPDPADLEVLSRVMATDGLMTVIERRLERALLATLKVLPESERSAALTKMLGGLKGDGEFRGARLARIAAIQGERGLGEEERANILRAIMQGGNVDARAAAAKALATIGDEGVQLALKELSNDSVEARLGLQCIRVVQQNGSLVPEEESKKEDGEAKAEAKADPSDAVKFLIVLAEDHPSSLVQEQAVIALGQPGIHTAAVTALTELAKTGRGIDLRNVATVALGRTRAETAVATLAELLRHDDWMMRAAAAEGLLQVSRMECVAPLLDALDDENPQVAATAEEALKRFSNREGEDVERSTWRDWWAANGQRARFRTREETRARQERYGYSVSDAQIYEGLDVIVVPGLGDHIEKVLEQLGIEFRTVQAGKLDEAALHPGAILLIGCTGEISASDVEVVQWYVRTGGALFTSCWALTHTVVPTSPAVIRKAPTPGEVVDHVFARPTTSALESPYLRGVFDGGVQPFYSLEGAHLIQVVDPERAEVILDSPYTAARHGSGDLSAYFRMGHGVILDTANHFEEQGFTSAEGLKGDEECQAFAVNHMGYSLEDLRQTRDEKWWKSASKAASEIADLSVFRILTNFVREKRING
ncbi:HEAT repeat protein [Planctomycetes bacterium Poly30]|uniref:HEAT repeat protein n=2 Tax=Saltatorellus ferox TaxID=2528018 RepID=A0A518ET15_9BACT|nr:HEAT repeat protein [Planctomycetes bacterium Poly30]